MRWLPKRRYFWLGLAVLLLAALVAGMLAPRNRINRASFDRIQNGMLVEEVTAILGDCQSGSTMFTEHKVILWLSWYNGPNYILVVLEGGKVSAKDIHLATAWETLQWYAKKIAEKIEMRGRPAVESGHVTVAQTAVVLAGGARAAWHHRVWLSGGSRRDATNKSGELR